MSSYTQIKLTKKLNGQAYDVYLANEYSLIGPTPPLDYKRHGMTYKPV